MPIRKLIEQHGFSILFLLSLITIITLFVVNWWNGHQGTYVDHSDMIWALLDKKSYPSRKVEKGSFESKGELECRQSIEQLTGKPFPKARPSFLNNTVSGHALELDCYNEELKLAVEYNGEQHYRYIPHFHSSKDAYYNLKYRDEMKERLCRENKIRLIIVPYTVKKEDILSYIKLAMSKFEST